MKLFFIPLTITLLLTVGFVSSNHLTDQSQDIQQLEKEKAVLYDKIRNLELEMASKKSLETLNQKARAFGMVEVRDVWYIGLPEPIAALR
jgi:cell division protein FtsB